MKKHFPFLVLLFASMALYGQGTVKGVITGSDENAPLLAATVFVKGTTTGTVTDYNGEYVLVLKAGTYTLQVSYIGYETTEETITVENRQMVEMNTTLKLVSIRGEEAVVTAQARGQLAAVNQQLRSNKIVNVVSSERIKELPDQNAAQAVSRLPGIHLDGSKIVIRGIQPKMNKILINGVEMPSTEANSRATSIGMISANMLSGIEVYKTLTPDMDADAIGGVVNLTLREAPKGLHYNAMVQGTYNAQERFMGNFRVWGDVSNRFFNDKFGVSLSMNYDKSRGGSDEVSSEYIRLSEATLGTADYMIDVFTVSDAVSASESFGGSLILDYKLPKGKLVFTNMINHTEPDNLTYIDDYSLGQFRRHILLEHSRHKSLLLNNSLQYEQQIGIAKLDASVSYISIKREDVFSYSYEFGPAGSTLLVDSLPNARRLVMEPWEIYGAEIPDAWEKLLMGNFFWDPETYGENQVIANLNLEVPIRITDQISATLKTGGKYRRMDREFDNSRSQYGEEINRTLVQSDMQEFLASMGHNNVGSALKNLPLGW